MNTPNIMHVDINSCFATVEQQANPLLRGRPVAVAAYTTGNGCILAASVEAKRIGIKTGMRVRDGLQLCPRLAVLPPDSEKYRFVNHKLRDLLGFYTPNLSVESIDEMVMNLAGTPVLTAMLNAKCQMTNEEGMVAIAREIKQRVKTEIGEWMTVSVGIAPNRYLAKVASTLHKPDGLDVITGETLETVFGSLKLEDLCGIKAGVAGRLRAAGITTPLAMCRAQPLQLVTALRSKMGYSWWLRLHGREDGGIYKSFDAAPELQKTFGQSYALKKALVPQDPELWQILAQLVTKMGRRLRQDGFVARGVAISCLFADFSHWGHRYTQTISLFADDDLYRQAHQILTQAPSRPVRILAVTSFALLPDGEGQLGLWEEGVKKRQVTQALDTIADRFGEFVVVSGRMLGMQQKVLDRIAFGKAGIRSEISPNVLGSS